MSHEQNRVNNKAKEYVAILKTKTTQDLVSLRERLLSKFKAERLKSSPNKSLLHDYNIQLSLLGRELKSRLPIHEQGDTFHAVEEATIGEFKPKTFAQILAEKTLDDLKKMLIDAEKELSDFKQMLAGSRMTADAMESSKAKLEALSEKVEAIKSEISTRSEQASEDAKKDADTGKLFGVDKDYIAPAIAGGVIVGVLGYSMGKNVLGFSLIGIGIGSGIVWLTKRDKKPKVATP